MRGRLGGGIRDGKMKHKAAINMKGRKLKTVPFFQWRMSPVHRSLCSLVVCLFARVCGCVSVCLCLF